jgi:tRNA-dihydrouridine synthase A
MMDWTDRHCRMLHRTLTSRALLYSEMLTTGAILHGDRTRLLAFDAGEHPVALQLGGSEPADLAAAARIGEAEGYDEINLNVGCPSDRVQSGRFGACLMREPQLVADCMAAIAAAVTVPATVKCRIGVDDQDPEQSLFTLVDLCAEGGRLDLRGPRPQGLAERPVAQGKPRRPAAGLCPGSSPEARTAGPDHRDQRRGGLA